MEKSIMFRNSIFNSKSHQRVARYVLVNVSATLIFAAAQPALAQAPQKTFASPAQAAQALCDAVRSDDDQAVESILGGAELTSSGNDNEDKLDRDRFAKKYAEMHRLVREPDGSIELYVGAENWPFPIPLVKNNGQWHFDADSGSMEVRAREIGENETSAIQVCQAISSLNSPDANKTSTDNAVLEFARHLNTSEKPDTTAPEAFRGYYFRVSKETPGNMLLVAYPDEYGASGVMTFVLARGSVYERDLGPRTSSAAEKIQKPTAKWKQVQLSHMD
jgi:hypothetical protein